jgi:hypothetical protein
MSFGEPANPTSTRIIKKVQFQPIARNQGSATVSDKPSAFTGLSTASSASQIFLKQKIVTAPLKASMYSHGSMQQTFNQQGDKDGPTVLEKSVETTNSGGSASGAGSLVRV